MTNRTLYVAIVGALMLLLALSVFLMPAGFQTATFNFVVAALVFVWTLVKIVFLWAGPAIIASYFKRGVTALDKKFEPNKKFSDKEIRVISGVASLVIGVVWIFLPDLLVVPGGWYVGILREFGATFMHEMPHFVHAIVALLISAIWLGISNENGALEM